MGISLTSTKAVDLGNGKTTRKATEIPGELTVVAEVTVPAAQAGTLTTRTDNDTGTITGLAGHTITTGMTVDIYWNGGQRRGMTVGTVSGTSIPIDGGSGTNLPSTSTAVIIGRATAQPFPFTGDNGVALCLITGAALRGQFVFLSSAPAELYTKHMDPENDDSNPFIVDFSVSNPLSGVTVASLLLSHADVDAAQVMKVWAIAA